MIWSYTNMPPKPYKLFLVEADYRKNVDKHPIYEVATMSKKGLKKWFEETFNLKVVNIEEAPENYQPNKWYIERYGKERNWGE